MKLICAILCSTEAEKDIFNQFGEINQIRLFKSHGEHLFLLTQKQMYKTYRFFIYPPNCSVFTHTFLFLLWITDHRSIFCRLFSVLQLKPVSHYESYFHSTLVETCPWPTLQSLGKGHNSAGWACVSACVSSLSVYVIWRSVFYIWWYREMHLVKSDSMHLLSQLLLRNMALCMMWGNFSLLYVICGCQYGWKILWEDICYDSELVWGGTH